MKDEEEPFYPPSPFHEGQTPLLRELSRGDVGEREEVKVKEKET